MVEYKAEKTIPGTSCITNKRRMAGKGSCWVTLLQQLLLAGELLTNINEDTIKKPS